jgi:glycosyltransferase involved in cell wall biosynthesis
MARASIYALPARYEPFGLSVLDAALSGCALVLGDIPSLREIWQDNAVFVPPDDEQALRRAIERLAHNDSQRQALSVAARVRAESFGAERMGRRYLDLYRELVARRAAGAVAPPATARPWEDEGGMAV